MKYVKEHINEKFTADSDPIHDMGIGMTSKAGAEILKNALDKKIFEVYVSKDNYIEDLYIATINLVIPFEEDDEDTDSISIAYFPNSYLHIDKDIDGYIEISDWGWALGKYEFEDGDVYHEGMKTVEEVKSKIYENFFGNIKNIDAKLKKLKNQIKRLESIKQIIKNKK